MTLHWKDGTRGEERSVRQRRADVITRLQKARRYHLLVTLPLLIAPAALLLNLFLLVFVAGQDLINTIGTLGGLVGTVFGFRTVAFSGRYVRDRRNDLAAVQRDYDDVFFRLTLEEHGRPVEELLADPESH